MTQRRCDFCEIIAGRAPAKIEHEWVDAIAIHTLRPKAEGHLLVIPKKHVQDANEDPYIAGLTLRRAAEIAKPPSHIHTNIGGAAAQTVFHLHFHVIPRKPGQEVRLSWFKPWDEHPLDRKCEEKMTPAKSGMNFSTELQIGSATASLKMDFTLLRSMKRMFRKS